MTQFHVRPSEIVDITRDLTRGGGPTFDAVVARECGADPPDPLCRQRFITDVTGTALYYEGQSTASLGMLRTLVEPDGKLSRPQDAAARQRRHDRQRHAGRPSRSRRARHPGGQGSRAREHDHLHACISSRASASGSPPRRGWPTRTWSTGVATAASWGDGWNSSRAPREARSSPSRSATPSRRSRASAPSSSSYYLLGVEPGDEDRDGRTHEIAVKTTQPNVTIRGRRWVMVPKRGGAPVRADIDQDRRSQPRRRRRLAGPDRGPAAARRAGRGASPC